MDKLEKARKEINEADKEIAALFVKRMTAVKDVAEYKKERGLPVLDRERDCFTRASNNAGGLEGGMTTGLPLVATVAMKPIPTLMRPLATVNMDTLEVADASKERSDVCAVPAAAVVAEGEVAFVLANAYQEMFGGSCMADIKANLKSYKARLRTMSR